jgi:hypothetical protein
MAIVKDAKGLKKLLISESFLDERELEDILAEKPQLMIDEGEPDVLLLKRQVTFEGTGTADLLLIDSDGLPMVVEVKLRRNSESRRQVVGQVFDYVSSLTLLTVDELDQKVAGTLKEAIRVLCQEESEEDAIEKCWQACGVNLRAGKARVVVAIDEASEDLIRILRFLNDHSDLDVRLVELKKYLDKESSEIFFVPRLIVYGGDSTTCKSISSASYSYKKWDEESFFKNLEENQGLEIGNIARKIFEWTRNNDLLSDPWGRGEKSASFTPKFVFNKNKTSLFNIYSSGNITIPLDHIKRTPPFNIDANLIELIHGINQTLNLSITHNAKYPSIPLSHFKNNELLTKFFEILEWMINRIKSNRMDET